jgi:hypothetical protein
MQKSKNISRYKNEQKRKTTKNVIKKTPKHNVAMETQHKQKHAEFETSN